MKILEVDSVNYRIFGDELKIDDKLPAGVYNVCFSKMQGFWLHKHENLTVNEKLYGNHEEKIDKLMRAYDAFDRSMGVIFSGDKGIGKSIAARMLCEKSVAKGLPVILVDENIPGIANFIDSIQQECVVLFDEFEKNFRKIQNDGDEIGNEQDALLSLFDGTSSTVKRMYLITCNDLWQLSDFLVNRPGRFHYHIRWKYPNHEEVKEYLADKVDPTYWGEIQNVLAFASRVKLNYDCLRAIAFELNLGQTFQEAIEDLNIKDVEGTRYNLVIELVDGSKYKARDIGCDLFSAERINMHVWNWDRDGNDGTVSFIPIKARAVGDTLQLDLSTTDMHYCGKDEETPAIKSAYLQKCLRENVNYNVAGIVA